MSDPSLANSSTRAGATVSPPPAALQIAVAAALVAEYLIALALRRDYNCYDDVARTLLSRGWAETPYLLTSDLYWLPLPFAFRGTIVAAGGALGLSAHATTLWLLRPATIAILWGAWRLLASVVASIGGGPFALALFTLYFLPNFATYELASSVLSEPGAILASASALAIVARCESTGRWTAGRIAGLSAVFSASCLMRYESWTLWFAFAVAAIAFRRDRLPGRLASLPLAAPGLLVAAWLAVCWARTGSPLHFLGKGKTFIDILGGEDVALRTAKSFLKLQPALIPALCVGAIAAIPGLAREATGRWLLGAIAILGAWCAFKTGKIAPIPRYAWDFGTLAAVAGAVGCERLAARLSRRARVAALVALGAVAAATFAATVARQRPFVPPELRTFAETIRREAPEGKILLRDHEFPADNVALDCMRALIDGARFVPVEWLEPYGETTPEHYRVFDLRVVVARRPPGDVPLVEPPIATSPTLGWKAWRTAPDG